MELILGSPRVLGLIFALYQKNQINKIIDFNINIIKKLTSQIKKQFNFHKTRNQTVYIQVTIITVFILFYIIFHYYCILLYLQQ